MIDRIIEFSAHHRFLVLGLTVAAVIAGWRSLQQMPMDALPDLSDKQVIVYSRWDRSPDLVDAQVTYPIVSALLGAPHVKSVRGISDFGSSFVYVIFDEDTDLYWARSRTVEYLSGLLPHLPEGVRPELGPDATGLGWIYQYVLLDRSGKHSLADLRSFQDWYVAYWLKSVPGVAEVASVGGFVRQYQVQVDPNRLRAFALPIQSVVEALKSGNSETGGRVLDSGGTEYMVRGRGYAHSPADLEDILINTSTEGAPVRIKDVAQVGIGADFRRGFADLDGRGDTVSGIVIMRQGENPLDVIERVKARINQIAPSLPPGIQILPIYDRSELIHRSIDNLKTTIVEVIVTVAAVIFLFLSYLPMAMVAVITIPLAVLIAFVPFRLLGVGSNIMSLAGIAIAVGALVDSAIVIVEQTHKRLAEWEVRGRRQDHRVVIIDAVKQVAGPSFFALLVIAVSFLPVLTLEAQEGRLFRPLAYTKTLSMIIAAVLAITLTPVLCLLFIRLARFEFRPAWLCRAANAVFAGEIHPEERHPVSGRIIRLYEPVVNWTLSKKPLLAGIAVAMMIGTFPIWQRLGTDFMPPLDEGVLLYMPTTMPTISGGEAQRLLQATDRILKQYPEVDHVLGKAGRANTATDPAPLSMFETVITLRPMSEWPRMPTWYSAWAPEWASSIFRHITPDHMSPEELVNKMNETLRLPGLANAWSMPIRGRIEMLTTGLRTSVGIKIAGSNLEDISHIGTQLEVLLRPVKGTRGVFAERTNEGYYLDLKWNRDSLARYGLSLDDAQDAVQYAIGGENVTVLVAGRERYPVNVRYLRDFRSDPDALGRVLVTARNGSRQVPASMLAQIQTVAGPSMIRDEGGMLTSYVYVDIDNRDPQSYVSEAARLVREKVALPPGNSISWSGQYEAIERMKGRLTEIVPLTLFLILMLLYWNTRSLTKTFIVLLAVPFSAIGAIWTLYLLGYHLSVAVWVGLIALLGVDAETGIFMLLYLDQSYYKMKHEGQPLNEVQLRQAVIEGAAKRIRPKLMTTVAMFAGLVPILWSTGTGSEVMKRIAAPMIGGVFTSFALELLIYPMIYHTWRRHAELKRVTSFRLGS